MAFRGVGKSWITAAYVLWRLLRDPQLNIMVVSASKERSDQFVTFCLQLLDQLELLNHMYPTSHQRSSKVSFDVAPAEPDQNPSVKAAGIFGQITGTRADIIIADDVEVPNTSETMGMREKLHHRVGEFEAILKPGGSIWYLGTPQCEESIYNGLREAGYATRIWPARVPSQKLMEAYGSGLSPSIEAQVGTYMAGRTTDPERFTDDDLTG